MFREEERNNRSGSTEQRRDNLRPVFSTHPDHRRYIAKCKEKPPGYSIDRIPQFRADAMSEQQTFRRNEVSA
jgi:hypothetical protein